MKGPWCSLSWAVIKEGVYCAIFVLGQLAAPLGPPDNEPEVGTSILCPENVTPVFEEHCFVSLGAAAVLSAVLWSEGFPGPTPDGKKNKMFLPHTTLLGGLPLLGSHEDLAMWRSCSDQSTPRPLIVPGIPCLPLRIDVPVNLAPMRLHSSKCPQCPLQTSSWLDKTHFSKLLSWGLKERR